MEGSARKLARQICQFPEEESASATALLTDFQVQIVSNSRPMGIRHLDSSHIGKFVRIPGIVVSASNVIARPTNVCIQCRACKTERSLAITSSFGAVPLPRQCPGPAGGADLDTGRQPCPRDPFVILPERSHCVDQQSLKIQEAPDSIPVGELPRQVLLTLDRALVNRVAPGTRIIANGIYAIFQAAQSSSSKSATKGAVAIRSPYLRIVGLQIQEEGTVDGESKFQNSSSSSAASEESQFAAMAREPGFMKRFVQSIGPSIFGNDDIKEALACLLFGGSRKILPDGLKLRGDINVLLLGDPGTAKSQFLKFIERVAPISVYTSGKGSSAAGLTATVVRDPRSGDFYLEGGAMVLADGGVVCIDEFDKMNLEDRVAIHEAMEQQTISIAKAGITTILNSRTSVLAAANPVFGRYDEMRTPGENIDFSSTILSRFDMIFVVRDEHDLQRDASMARHVISVHMKNPSTAVADGNNSGEFDLGLMKRYIRYCKGHCAPRLSQEAAQKLAAHYVTIRNEVYRMGNTGFVGGATPAAPSTIPITIRQLEAIVRIAESLAKMTLSTQATVAHVDEAIRLFRVSTLKAVMSGQYAVDGITAARPDLLAQMDRIEKAVRVRLPVGSSIAYRNLLREMVDGKHFPEPIVMRTLDVMVQQEKLMLKAQGKVLIRQR